VRAQTSLPALGIAFLLLTAGLVVTVTAAGSALEGADRPTLDRQAAVALSEHLVRGSAPLTERPNVVNGSRLAVLTAADLRERYGLAPGAEVRVRVGQRVVVEDGSPDSGVTIERLVLIERRQERTIVPTFRWSKQVSLPRRTPRIELVVQPSENTTVRTVSIDGRVRLRNPSGLRGRFEIPVSMRRPPTLRFDTSGQLARGSVRVRYYPPQTEKARLVVTVDE
jgi:hypothetical protein